MKKIPIQSKNDINIVIIGNGFDLHHSLKTSFLDFVKSDFCSCEVRKKLLEYSAESIDAELVNPFSDVKYRKTRNVGNNWSNIEQLYFDTIVTTYVRRCDKWDNEHTNLDDLQDDEYISETRKLLEIVNDTFFQFKNELYYYLKEITRKPVKLCEDIRQVVESADIIVDFNYTNLVEKYNLKQSCQHIQIHGSLKENTLVLGFPHAAEEMLRNYRIEDRIAPVSTSSLNSRYNEGGNFDLKKLQEFFGNLQNIPLEKQIPEFYEGLKTKQIQEQNRYRTGSNGDFFKKFKQLNDSGLRAVRLTILGHSFEGDWEVFNDIFTQIQNRRTEETKITIDCNSEFPGDIIVQYSHFKKVDSDPKLSKEYQALTSFFEADLDNTHHWDKKYIRLVEKW